MWLDILQFKLFCHLIYSVKFKTTELYSVILFSVCKPCQTQCFASVSPSGTLRIPGLASWTVVRSGFKVVCQHKLNASNPDDTDNSYQEDLEIHCKIFTSDWSEILHWVYLPWKFKQYNELGLCFFWKSWDKLQQSSYRYVGVFMCDKTRRILICEVNENNFTMIGWQ